MGPSTAGHGVQPEDWFVSPGRLHGVVFYLEWLSNGDFWVRDGDMCSLLSVLGSHLMRDHFRSCDCCHRFCEFICEMILLCLEGFVSLVPSSPSISHHLSSLSLLFHRAA